MLVRRLGKYRLKNANLTVLGQAKLKGTCKVMAIGSKEDTLQFLGKFKNQKALQYLKQGFKGVEVSKLTGIHINTITKIKKLGLQ